MASWTAVGRGAHSLVFRNPGLPAFFDSTNHVDHIPMVAPKYSVSVKKANEGTPEPYEYLIVSLDLLTGAWTCSPGFLFGRARVIIRNYVFRNW